MDQFEHLDHVELIAHGGAPAIRVRLLDDPGALVDLSSGYSDFQAVVVRRNAPETAALTISSGVTGDADGFLVPADQIVELSPRFDYILTCSATDSDSGQPRRAMAIITLLPAPAPA